MTWPGTSVTLTELAELIKLLTSPPVVDVILVLASGPHGQDALRDSIETELTDDTLAAVIARLTTRHIIDTAPSDAGWPSAPDQLHYRLTSAGQAIRAPLAEIHQQAQEHEEPTEAVRN